MKISETTLNVLKNFSDINPSIYVTPGSTLKTMSPHKSMFAIYQTEEEFDKEFGIYDLSQFISCLSLFKEPELEFENEKYLSIKDETKSFANFFFCKKEMITTPPEKELNFPKDAVKFKLTDTAFKKILQASNVLQLPDIRFYSDDDQVKVECLNTETKTSNKMSLILGEAKKEFSVHFKAENLKLISSSYEVEVAKNITRFTGADGKLVYYIAPRVEKQ